MKKQQYAIYDNFKIENVMTVIMMCEKRGKKSKTKNNNTTKGMKSNEDRIRNSMQLKKKIIQWLLIVTVFLLCLMEKIHSIQLSDFKIY